MLERIGSSRQVSSTTPSSADEAGPQARPELSRSSSQASGPPGLQARSASASRRLSTSGEIGSSSRSQAEAISVLSEQVEQVSGILATEAGVAVNRNVRARALLLAKQRCGATQEDFKAFTALPFVAWAPSASAGDSLRGLNDHAGVLVVAARDGAHTVAERLAVVKETVDGEQRYFVKGYGDRVVPFADITAWIKADQQGAAATSAGGAQMETPLRTELRRLSEASTLFTRRSERESDDVLMAAPPDLAAMPRPNSWANSEHAMPKGFGPLVASGPDGSGEAARAFFMDYNGVENRIIIFKRDDTMLRRDLEAGQPTAVNINGQVLAELHGIKSIEIMGPAGVEPGVKNATLKQAWDLLCGAPAQDQRTLRVITEDSAVHELLLSDSGIEMKLVNPQPSTGQSAAAAAFGGGQRVGADVDVYSYRGIDTGTRGTPDGFADPKLVLSSGESLAAGPLVHDRASAVKGTATSLAHGFMRLATFTPNIGKNASSLATLVNTAVVAASKAVVVAGFNVALQTLQGMNAQGTLLGGGRQFSGIGAGQVQTTQLAGAIFSMVLAQQGISAAISLGERVVAPFLPQSLTDRTMPGSRLLMDMALPAAQEFSRLLTNYSVQQDWGLPRGGLGDLGMLAPQSAISGLIEFTRRRAGEPQNHPLAFATLAGLDVANDTVFRSLGAAMGSPNYEPGLLGSDLLEAMAARLLVRGGDKLVMPLVAVALNEAGVIGPNASAFDHQTSVQGGMSNALAWIQSLADSASVGVHEKVDKPALALLDFMIDGLRDMQTAVQHALKPSLGAIDSELAAVNESAGFPRLESEEAQATLIARQQAEFQKLIVASRDAGTPSLVRNSRSELPPAQGHFMQALDDASSSDRERRYPTFTDASGTARPRNAQVPGLADKLRLRDTPRVPLDATTFSRVAQHYAKPTHDIMSSVPGMASIHDAPALSSVVRANIESAVRAYTEESQFFHYPLRWEVTGQPEHIELAPGIDFVYRVMNKPGNTTGDPKERLDPIGALYVNLGALHAEKFPALVQRAAGTEARYGMALPTNPPTQAIDNEDVVALTEILSATTSSRMAAAFGQALGFGAMRKDRSQRFVIQQESAVNIARYTDLVQAEVIAMPGGLFKVKHVDADPGKPEGDRSKDIGQVVYMEAIDTAELERRHPAFYGPDGEPPAFEDGDLAIHPQTGHIYRWDAKAGELKYASLEKNYFLGQPMERTRLDESTGDPQPQGELALWRHPYTADGAKRATKDAIHAAILRGDPIVEHLDDAIQNVHHKHFRDRSGFALSPAARSEASARAQTRADAAEVSRALNALRLDSPLPADGGIGMGHEMLAWLTTSLLRRPIQLLPVVDGSDGPSVNTQEATLVAMTYDKVNLAFERPVAIGVGRDGFYALRNDGGEIVPQRIAADRDGATVGNFLHAFVHAGYEQAGEYRRADDGTLRPDGNARRGAARLLEKAQALAATPYQPLQAALVQQARAQGLRLGAADEASPVPSMAVSPDASDEESESPR